MGDYMKNSESWFSFEPNCWLFYWTTLLVDIFGANFDQVWPDEVLQSQTVNMNAYEYHTLTLIGLLNIPDR